MEMASLTLAVAADVENSRGAGEHVLVADDEEFFRDVTLRLLTDFGYIVHIAANGVEAVRVFEQHRADITVALVDLDMPVMDGPTAIKAMRAINPRVRIITVSGSGDSAAQHKVGDADLQLMKPYTMGALLQGLRKVLAKSAAA
jgi:CheY-like chemotaxis protein